MSTVETENNTTLPEVEDRSHFVEGFSPETLIGPMAKFVKSVARKLQGASDATYAACLAVGIVALNTRDENEFPCWNVGEFPQAAKDLLAAIFAAAGLSDAEGKAVLQDAPRTLWNRTVREMFLTVYVLSTVEGATVNAGVEVKTQQANNYARALKMLPEEILNLLPEPLDASPFTPATTNKAFQKGMANQLNHWKLDVPEKYGGEPKGSGNASGTKDKRNESPEITLQEVAAATAEKVGTEGGPSGLSVARGSLAVISALVLGTIGPNVEIQDREAFESVLLRIAEVATIGAKNAHGSYDPDTDGVTLASVQYDPENDR